MKKTLMGMSLLSLIGLLTACGGGGGGSATPAPSTPAPAKQETPAAQAPAGNTANASAAENTFKQTCAACHGADLKGAVGPNLTQIGSKYSKDQILGIIANGKGAMPPGLLKGADADAVATWLAAKK